MDIGLIACTKSKKNHRYKAIEMYSPSALFRKASSYAIKKYDRVAILSAKYGLLLPEDEINPYELTLKKMSKKERNEWAIRVFEQMKRRLNLSKGDRAFFHAGKEYRESLIPKLIEVGVECYVPLEVLSFGKQLEWYDKH